MPDASIPASPPAYRDSDSAPFIVFDVAGAFGVMAGAIQVELGGRTLRPIPDGDVTVEFITTAHLRCSPAAAMNLRDALDNALKMLQQPPDTSSTASKLN